MKTQKTDKWEKEFDKRFVRSDGLMDKYGFLNGEQCYLKDEIKSFISNLHSQILQEIKKKVEGMKCCKWTFKGMDEKPSKYNNVWVRQSDILNLLEEI